MRAILTDTKIWGWVAIGVVLTAAGIAGADTSQLPADLAKTFETLPDATTKIDFLKEKIEAQPEVASLHYALGNLLFDEGQLEEAATHLSKASELDPGFIGAFVNLGSVYDEMGQLDLSLETYDKALAIDPTDEKTLCNKGGVYFRKRQIDLALESFSAALDAHPQSQLAHYNIAILFADAGIYREAEAEWKKAVEIDPESDLGRRSADNIEIIRQLQEAEEPEIPASSSSDEGAEDGHAHDGHDHGKD